jgi:hypothetical protein
LIFLSEKYLRRRKAFYPPQRLYQVPVIIDPVATKDLFATLNPVRQEDRTSFSSITNPHGDSSQVNMKSGAKRPWKNDSQIKIPLL